jgi:hypothetical protein
MVTVDIFANESCSGQLGFAELRVANECVNGSMISCDYAGTPAPTAAPITTTPTSAPSPQPTTASPSPSSTVAPSNETHADDVVLSKGALAGVILGSVCIGSVIAVVVFISRAHCRHVHPEAESLVVGELQ